MAILRQTSRRLWRQVHNLSMDSSVVFKNTAANLGRDLPAFVFDIDGVLIRGRHVLPAAIRAMEMLYTPDKSQPKVPVAFLTNGGGVTESFKAKELSNWLGVNVTESQVVLSHTPFKSFASQYAEKPILVVGR